MSESMNVRNEEWGEDRLIKFAKTCHGLPALEAFAVRASQHDDMTLVVFRVLV
jgi:serine phosphatase RsbU (regulator of sigma subunit)